MTFWPNVRVLYDTMSTGAGKSSARIGDGPILTLEKVERQQAGIYQCTADNGVGDPVSVDIRLDVLCKFSFKIF
uniref:Ig-like domain-containing protein n=1 Tax=Glossina palpalis gambiensis TaxID=67801 RepID=A0A1B0B736_9MUSC